MSMLLCCVDASVFSDELQTAQCLEDGVCAGSIAEDPFNCEVISHEEGAIQQLILMALSDNEVVVEQACKTIGEMCC